MDQEGVEAGGAPQPPPSASYPPGSTPACQICGTDLRTARTFFKARCKAAGAGLRRGAAAPPRRLAARPAAATHRALDSLQLPPRAALAARTACR